MIKLILAIGIMIILFIGMLLGASSFASLDELLEHEKALKLKEEEMKKYLR